MLLEIDIPILLRAMLAAALGFVIGWERLVTGSPIRTRTFALATMTAAMLTSLGMHLFPNGPERIIQGIVTGIGFLGAGVIMRSSTGEVRGLTTAAGLWGTSAIGVAVGSGHELLGVALTAFTYLVMAWEDWPVMTRLRKRWVGKSTPETVDQQTGLPVS